MNDPLDIITQGIVAIVDTFVSSSPKRLAHVWAPLLFGVTYLVFNVTYTVSGGTDRDGHPWIYPITDWLGKPGISCLFVLAVVVMVFVVHFGLWAVQCWWPRFFSEDMS